MREPIKILDGPLEEQETFPVDHRLMVLNTIIDVEETVTIHFEKGGHKKRPTGKYHSYRITKDGLKYVD